MAQTADGTRPKYPGMPDTAIASGMIDFAVPVQEMPSRIASFVEGLDTSEQLEVGADDGQIARFDEFRGRDLRASAGSARPRFQWLQDQDVQSADPASQAAAPDRLARGLRHASASRLERSRRAVPRSADQRHELLSRSRRLRGTADAGDPWSVRGQAPRRHGTRLGPRLCHRRGGLLHRHPLARAHGHARHAPACADLRDRHRRTITRCGARGPLPRTSAGGHDP